MPTIDTEIKPEIRLFGQDDIRMALHIEESSFDHPWESDDFLEFVGSDTKRAYVAKIGNGVLGYVAYEILSERRSVRIHNIAVDRMFRRKNVGTTMLNYLYEMFKPSRDFDTIMATVRETNVAAQVFLRECGYRCTQIINGFYKDTDIDEPAYLMKRRFSRSRKF